MGQEATLSGGFDAVFVQPLDQRFCCPVCLVALRDPVQTKCGHRFCRLCLRRCVRSSRYGRCPADNLWFDPSRDVFSDVAIGREILSLRVSCDLHLEGCDWTGELRALEKHMPTCAHAFIVCSNNCGAKCKRSELDAHLVQCPRRFASCPHCGEEVVAADLTKHQLLACPQFPVNCILCGQTGLVRSDIKRHTDPHHGDCPEVIVKCEFKTFGCYSQDKRRHLARHLKDANNEHLMLLRTKVTDQDETITRQDRDISQLVDRCRDLSDVIRHQDVKLREHSQLLGEITADIYEISSSSWNGELQWKISLPDDDTRCVYSPVFYTGRPGYKLQIKLDFIGAREGDEWYTTASLVLLKGYMDNYLRFPADIAYDLTIRDVRGPQNNNHQLRCLCSQLGRPTTENMPVVSSGQVLMKTEELLANYAENATIFSFCKVNILV